MSNHAVHVVVVMNLTANEQDWFRISFLTFIPRLSVFFHENLRSE